MQFSFTKHRQGILIIFKNNTKKIIDNVSAYGLLSDRKFFYFNNDDIKSFIPADLVNYFGSLEAWDDDKTVKDESIVIDRLKEYIHRLENQKEHVDSNTTDLKKYTTLNILTNVITSLTYILEGE